MRLIVLDLPNSIESVIAKNKKEGIVFSSFMKEFKYGPHLTKTDTYRSANEIAQLVVSNVICDISPYIKTQGYRYNKEIRNNLFSILELEEENLNERLERIQITKKIIRRKNYFLK